MSRRKHRKSSRSSDRRRKQVSRRPGRRKLWTGALILLFGGVGAFAAHRAGWYASDTPESASSAGSLPTLDTSDMQPHVARSIQQAHTLVLEQPNAANAWAKLGAVYEVHFVLSRAEACYRRAHALAPSDFRWTYFLAIVLDILGTDVDESVELFQEAARLRPGYAPLHFRIGDAFAKHGKLESARNAYGEAIRLNPDLAIAYYGQGNVLLKLGDVPGAISHLERAAALAPKDGPVFAALAQAYMRTDDRVRAVEAADRSRRLSPVLVLTDPIRTGVYALGVSSRVCYRRAANLLKTGGGAAALPYLRTLEQVQPDDPKVHLWSAFAHLRIGEREATRRYLAEAMRLREQLLIADRDILALPVARRQLDETLREFWREYLEAVTESAEQEELVRVTAEFAGLAAELPLTPSVYLAWGNALLASGDAQNAALQYEEAVRLDPGKANAYYQLGVASEEMGEVDEAIANYRRAVDLSPNEAAHQRLADVLQEQDSRQRADAQHIPE